MFVLPAQTAQPPAASIADLKEIPLPPPIPYTPQTAGWWVLGGIVLLAVLVYVALRLRRWWRNRYRRAAQKELSAIEQAAADPAQRQRALAALPALVKRTVLTWAPRDTVAPLSGEAWLGYLDHTFSGENFTRGPGRHLQTLAYGDGDLAGTDASDLMALLHRWIDDHVPA
ncbi:MAG TPA: DUF4381 domain-containing protein [Dyella sp.]|uniref:DUF4381 domain-containing protein n=1 Tax=Dyella sp. TaxID=1869338 RepID=UPI002D773897|nr:DUF4381 domain-containing protein [Dyella sp.]HET6553429.1 DUF4381 domain-containing protein [Dyella sp.]